MRLATAIVVVAVGWVSTGGCESGKQHRPAPIGADRDASVLKNGDGGDDEDAGTDPIAAATACSIDADCVIAIDLDLCCSCPRAVSRSYESAEACLEPWPAGTPSGECVVPCDRQCEPCGDPSGVQCTNGDCRLVFAGECTTADDCDPGEICVVAEGAARCDPDPTTCVEHSSCDAESWCAPADEQGVRRCRRLDPGQCGWDGNCGEEQQCLDVTADTPGHCEPRT